MKIVQIAASLVATGVLLPLTMAPAATGAGLPAAASGKVTACVHKKTGEMRLRTGKKAAKKCPKGWRKKTWATTGPAGAQGPGGQAGPTGPAGPQLSVKDRNGVDLGMLVGYDGWFAVLRDGGIFWYAPSGKVEDYNEAILYRNSACVSTAYYYSATDERADTLGRVGGYRRLVQRLPGQPLRAFQLTSTFEIVNAEDVWYRNSVTGACQAGSPASVTGDLFVLQEAMAPADAPGPLRIG